MTEKKKILIFSLAYHPFVGGAEVAIKEITDRLASAIGGPASGCDFQFEMITTNLDGKQKSEEQLGNVKVYRVGKGKIDKYLFPWLAYKKAKELHRQNNYSVIWAMMANQAGWAAMKFKRKYPRTQFLLTLQEGDSEWDIMIRTFLIRPIYKAIYRRADYIQAISSFLAKRARNLGAKSPIEVVPNGIDIKSEIRNSKFETNSNDQNIKLVITVSRLVKKNGVEDLIRAVQDVDGKLLILGDGELRNQLTNLVKELKLQDKVTFWGEVSNEQVYQYLSQADVFVRPSLSEGLGNAFLEAMSMNVPVIATEVGGIPDFIKDGETGWFCQVKDSKSITEKINYVLDEKNRLEVLRVIDNAKKLVDEKYDWDKITSQIRNIFYKLSGEIKFKKGKLISGIVYPEIMPIKKNETVLNIGCGDGVQAVIYGGSYSKMTGVDIQSERLEIAKKLMDFYNINNFEPVVANVEQIPLEEKYDKVMAIDIIEHVQKYLSPLLYHTFLQAESVPH